MILTSVTPINQKNKPNFGENEGVWTYFTLDKNIIGYHVRKKTSKGKIFVPISLQDGKWVNKWFEGRPKPLYNLPLLAEFPDKPILLVEGEKTADAASLLFPEFNVMTWMGGAGSSKKIEFEYFTDCDVYLFPDNDIPGYTAMENIKKTILPIAKSVCFIDIKSLGVRPKWDLADLEEREVDIDDIKLLIHQSKIEQFNSEAINPARLPDLSANARPLNTTDNIAYALAHYKIEIKYNLMTNYPEFYASGRHYSSINEADCYLTEISNICVRNSIPKVDLAAHVSMIADKRRYHPAIEFINSKPWDGLSRIKDLINTIDADNPELAGKLIYRWLIGCIAVLLNDNGTSLEGALVFQGKQYVGKSAWFIKLVPEKFRFLIKDGEMLNTKNKDDVMNVTQAWLCELAEFEGTFKKSDIEDLKAFITKSEDRYRVPFGKNIRRVPRKTSFFGSVNSVHYLVDDTGNRRYWTVAVNKINYAHTIDMQQVWSELKVLYEKGESFRLTQEEKIMLNAENENFRQTNPLEEAILNRFRWDEEYRNRTLSAKEVLNMLGFLLTDSSFHKNCIECGKILMKLTNTKGRIYRGRKVYDLPRESINMI